MASRKKNRAVVKPRDRTLGGLESALGDDRSFP